NLGKAKSTGGPGFLGIPSAGNVNMSIKTDGVMLGGAAFFPFGNQFSGVARLGAFVYKAKAEVSATGLSASASESHTEPYLGFAVDYAVNKQLSVEGGVDLTKVKFAGTSGTATLWSVGMRYAF